MASLLGHLEMPDLEDNMVLQLIAKPGSKQNEEIP